MELGVGLHMLYQPHSILVMVVMLGYLQRFSFINSVDDVSEEKHRRTVVATASSSSEANPGVPRRSRLGQSRTLP